MFFSPEELFNWLFRVVDATDESAEGSDVKDGVKDELEADEDLDVSSLPHPDINEAGIFITLFTYHFYKILKRQAQKPHPIKKVMVISLKTKLNEPANISKLENVKVLEQA